MTVMESLDLEACLVVCGQPLSDCDDADAEAAGSETAGDTTVPSKYVQAQDGEDFTTSIRSSALLLNQGSSLVVELACILRVLQILTLLTYPSPELRTELTLYLEHHFIGSNSYIPPLCDR